MVTNIHLAQIHTTLSQKCKIYALDILNISLDVKIANKKNRNFQNSKVRIKSIFQFKWHHFKERGRQREI